jgi:polyvinyl alcohol dehydrogenase (cytochrome)
MISKQILRSRFHKSLVWAIGILLSAGADAGAADQPIDERDWPMYNHDVIGTRHNRGERDLDRVTARGLEEKWRFPASGSAEKIGVIHVTPVVVNGYVYFGTATDPAFYKLTPDGKVRWSYRRAGAGGRSLIGKNRFQPSDSGILTTALVTDDMVYFADTGGFICALDRATGSERWKLNSRGPEFPGAHPINVFFAGPFVAHGQLIVAGGALEQVISASPFYMGNNGRGFVR